MHSVEFTSASLMQMGGKSYLMLELADTYIAKAFLATLEAGKRYIAELGIKRKKRSLEANAMMWYLCDQIARKQRITKEEVYRRNIKEVGVCEPLPIKECAVESFIWRWGQKGTGWIAEVIDDSKLKGYKLVHAYYGSSTYTTEEMSRLLDNVIQDAEGLGIEVISEREKALLMEGWDAKRN